MNYVIDEEGIGERLDVYISSKIKEYTRSYIKTLIDEEHILVNSEKKKSGYVLKKGDIIEVKKIEKKEMSIVPKKMDMNIIYEDDDVIIINKEKGVVVHPRKWKLYRYFSKWTVIFT